MRKIAHGPKFTRNKPEIDPKLTQNWTQINPKLTRNWFEIDSKSTHNRPEIGPKSTRNCRKIQKWVNLGYSTIQYVTAKFVMLRYQSVTCMLWIMLSRDDDIHDVGPDIHTCPDRDRRCVDSCVEMKLSNRAYNQDYNFYQKIIKNMHFTFWKFFFIFWPDVFISFWSKFCKVKYVKVSLR